MSAPTAHVCALCQASSFSGYRSQIKTAWSTHLYMYTHNLIAYSTIATYCIAIATNCLDSVCLCFC
jgi:hypothetical protein